MKITENNGQLKISIPSDIAEIKGWNGDTEVMFVPYTENPNDDLNEDSTIMLKEVKK